MDFPYTQLDISGGYSSNHSLFPIGEGMWLKVALYNM